MDTDTGLFSEIGAIIDTTIAAGQTAVATWIVHRVLADHADIDGADKDFYLLCAREHVRDAVRQVLRRRKLNETREDAQLVLPGFKHLHKEYLVERDGEQAVVPIDQLTPAEIETKAAEYRRMARSLDEHADELLRYRESKISAA